MTAASLAMDGVLMPIDYGVLFDRQALQLDFQQTRAPWQPKTLPGNAYNRVVVARRDNQSCSRNLRESC